MPRHVPRVVPQAADVGLVPRAPDSLSHDLYGIEAGALERRLRRRPVNRYFYDLEADLGGPILAPLSFDAQTVELTRAQVYPPGRVFSPSDYGAPPMPTPPPPLRQASFTVRDDAEAAFYSRVYWGGNFGSRAQDAYTHDDYVVTPEHCSGSDLRIIRAVRSVLGLGDSSYWGSAASSTPRSRAKLPREEIEALPLPG